jgi:hypothetical protein
LLFAFTAVPRRPTTVVVVEELAPVDGGMDDAFVAPAVVAGGVVAAIVVDVEDVVSAEAGTARAKAAMTIVTRARAMRTALDANGPLRAVTSCPSLFMGSPFGLPDNVDDGSCDVMAGGVDGLIMNASGWVSVDARASRTRSGER